MFFKPKWQQLVEQDFEPESNSKRMNFDISFLCSKRNIAILCSVFGALSIALVFGMEEYQEYKEKSIRRKRNVEMLLNDPEFNRRNLGEDLPSKYKKNPLDEESEKNNKFHNDPFFLPPNELERFFQKQKIKDEEKIAT